MTQQRRTLITGAIAKNGPLQASTRGFFINIFYFVDRATQEQPDQPIGQSVATKPNCTQKIKITGANSMFAQLYIGKSAPQGKSELNCSGAQCDIS